MDDFLHKHPTIPYFVLVALLSAINGVAIVLLWNWFISPLGAPPLSLHAAMGIFILIRLLSVHDYEYEMKRLLDSIPDEQTPDTMIGLYILSFRILTRKPLFAALSGMAIRFLQ